MDESRKPKSRAKRVVSEGRGVEKKGEGLGTGPLGNQGTYADRKAQQSGQVNQRPAGSPRSASPFTQSRPQQTGSPFTQSRPQQTGSGRPMGSSSPFTQSRPQQTGSGRPMGGSSPFTQSRPQQTGSGRPMGGSSPFTQSRPQRTGGGSASGNGGSAPKRSSGGGKLILIILALAALLGGGGGLSGLFGGGDSLPSALPGSGSSYTENLPASQSPVYGSSTSGSSTSASSPLSGSGASGLTDLFSSFLGSSSSSPYDFTGDFQSLFSGLGSGGLSSQGSGASQVSSASSGGTAADTTVSSKARAKYTKLAGKGKDTVTLMVYLCGTDLESRSGMATSDLKEMTAASFGTNVNLLVYTGGCRSWRNNVVSSSVNQIYQIQDGKLYCLEKNMGSGSMTDPKTLSAFIRYGAENFPANRMALIFWDHGGGSVSGYGHDEKYSSAGSMSLPEINSALESAGTKFDFIGFDTCLLATLENALMLSKHADYMIASEETEPGVGWYYTNWLNKLGANTSLSTVELGKIIADDFVAVCNRQCRGQATTLSLVDLAELQATVPVELAAFSRDASERIQNQAYREVSEARSNTREFARSSRIDQIDLVHFAKNLGTDEGKALARALQGAVKYNRTNNISNAYGLSIYFPYKRVGKVSQMVSDYQAIGMDAEYTRCIQEFASLELSGQAAAGTSLSDYSSDGIGMSSLLEGLLGGGASSGASPFGTSSLGGYSFGGSSSGGYSYGIPSSAGDMSDLLGGLFGGSSGGSGDLFSIFSGRSLTGDQVAEYLSRHHLDVSALVWQGNRITLSPAQWNEVESLGRNVFVDDGEGYIDLGLDTEFQLDGNSLVDDFDGTWISIDGQPIAYYDLGAEEEGDQTVFTGYTPALLNGDRVRLILRFDEENPYGYIAGAEPVYAGGETETQAKTLIQIGQGDRLQFLCDYYDYNGNYKDSYRLGDPIVLGAEAEIANTPVGRHPVRVTYCFTDYYQQRYWTPAREYPAS